MSCNICDEKYNKSTRCEIKCDFCDFSACKICQKKYILSVSVDVHCMNCKKDWDRQILINKFDRTFIDKQYNSHRERILFDREKAMLPATQPYVEKELACEKLNEEILQLSEQISQLQILRNAKISEKRKLLNFDVQEKKLFVRKCPFENCKGFLSSQWKCSLCENFTCKNCNEIKGTTIDHPHDCDKNNIETVKLLEKDTKSCPGCGTGIFKIEGCSQMFCTECHTAFDWKTGKIETGNIHNPHYFEYLRKTGNIERNIREIRCGREIDNQYAVYVIDTLRTKLTKNSLDVIIKIIRNILHIRFVELDKFSVDRIQNNLDLRISYMRNKLNEEQFKNKLQKREKDIQKKREITNILTMYINCMTEILYRYMEKLSNFDQMFQEMSEIKEYSNQCFANISNIYKCKKYQINKDFV